MVYKTGTNANIAEYKYSNPKDLTVKNIWTSLKFDKIPSMLQGKKLEE